MTSFLLPACHHYYLMTCSWVQDMDPDVHRIIEAEKQRQKRCVNLIASAPGNEQDKLGMVAWCFDCN